MTRNGNGQAAASTLPVATRSRWQPTRGGLLNLYRYDYEEFRYEQGHLLLRGNNGTGKSRVLALQLPFLLDGEVAPHRVEPDGDPAKRMEWNLLMGRYADRVGYTWLEFGRRDDAGDEHYFTIGCGLSAVEGRGAPERWYFVTRQRIGRDLYLQATAGHALSRDRLRELIGDHGEVITTVRRYRAAVDDALFKLGEQRYGALVDLLIQLRQPQLSRQLDEKKLSDALSQALPPMPESVLIEIAESFRGLETDRDELERYRKAKQNVVGFLGEYSHYVRIAARRRAEDVRRTHSAYESVQRDLRANEQRRDAATRALGDADRELQRLAQEEAAAAATERTLLDSPEMKSVRELERVRREASELDELAKKASGDLTEARSKSSTFAERASKSDRDAAEAALELQGAGNRARESAEKVGLSSDHEHALPSELDVTEGAEPQAKARISASVKRRQKASQHLRQQEADVARKERALEQARNELEQLKSQLDDAIEDEKRVAANVEAACTRASSNYRQWLETLNVLAHFLGPEEDADRVDNALSEWCGPGTGETPLTIAARAISNAASVALVEAVTSAKALVGEHDALLSELRAERERLAAGTHSPPRPPETRDAACRGGRPGAPLWRICDFRADLPEAARAGLEAALEGAGLLDAWVQPDGSLLAPGTFDTVLSCQHSPPVAGRSLGTLLLPAVDRTDPGAAAIDDAVVTSILDRIGAAPDVGTTWVDPDGNFRLGPLHGAWMKPAAEHIGDGAREGARKRRLLLLDAQIVEAESELARRKQTVTDIETRIRRAQEEARHAPDDAPLRMAVAERSTAAKHTSNVRERVTTAERRLSEARNAHEAGVSELRAAARDLGLEDWIGRIDQLDRAIADYEIALAGLWPSWSAHRAARARAVDAKRDAEDASRAVERQQQATAEAMSRSAAAAAERDALEQALGATAAEILARLDGARRKLAAVRKENEEAASWKRAFEREQDKAGANAELLGTQLEEKSGERDRAISHLTRFAIAGVLGIVIDLSNDAEPRSWSVSRAVDVARRAEAALQTINSSDAAWERAQGGIHRHIQALTEGLVGQGYSPEVTQDDDIMVVRAVFDGRLVDMVELRTALASEVENREQLLDAREREIIENHLIGEAAAHLHDLLHRAEEFKRGANEELARRPTSTGMLLRFDWLPVDDGPSGFASVRPRLLRATSAWSPADRDAVAQFLQSQIRAARARDDTAPWQEHLAVALDYRAWHRFVVERQQDNRWVRLTRRTHGTGSGGEKAIALTIPQFAAAAAHYGSADPLAPRLILLDEAFVGVDSDMRKKCVGLLHAFDLDFVMTSEREWCCYETLPGVAIYQLATRPGVSGIGVTRFVWNGRERVRDDTALPSAAPMVLSHEAS